MAPKTRAMKKSTASNPPANTSPRNLDAGIIDIKILANIHRYLSESSQEDDLALAAWIKQNFLYEPTDVGGRDISTAEGFFNLERAWRRVRTLTGKAVDKWPFFFPSWKKMTAPIVRKNAQGADGAGVSTPAPANASRDSTVKKESKGNSPALPTIPEAAEEAIVGKSSASASGEMASEDQPVKPVRGYEPRWKEPPVMKTNLDKLPPNSLLAKKRKAEAAAVQDAPQPKRRRAQSAKVSSDTRRSTRAKAGKQG